MLVPGWLARPIPFAERGVFGGIVLTLLCEGHAPAPLEVPKVQERAVLVVWLSGVRCMAFILLAGVG